MEAQVWREISGAATTIALCLPRRLVLQSKIEDALDELLVLHTRQARRLGEVLGTTRVGIGIGLQQVDSPVRSHPKVHPRVTVEAEDAIHALGEFADAVLNLFAYEPVAASSTRGIPGSRWK